MLFYFIKNLLVTDFNDVPMALHSLLYYTQIYTYLFKVIKILRKICFCENFLWQIDRFE